MEDDAIARARAGRGRWLPELAGKTAIVTGAGRLRSIGRSIAIEFARQGMNVVLVGTGRDPSTFPPDERAVNWCDVESVATEIEEAGGTSMTVIANIADADQVDALHQSAVDRFGGVDVLVNNAAAARGDDRADVVNLDFDDWVRVMNVNLHGTFLVSRAVARGMIARGTGGSIVNISSIGARLAPRGTSAYSVSKAGVCALSHAMAMELADHNIRVNAILPGMIETSRMDDLGRGEEWKNFIKSFIPLGRAGDGAEVANLCAFLCSDMGAYITGQDIAIDGGSTWH